MYLVFIVFAVFFVGTLTLHKNPKHGSMATVSSKTIHHKEIQQTSPNHHLTYLDKIDFVKTDTTVITTFYDISICVSSICICYCLIVVQEVVKKIMIIDVKLMLIMKMNYVILNRKNDY